MKEIKKKKQLKNKQKKSTFIYSSLNKSSNPWRHSISRDLGSDIDSMFSRSGATLPRGDYL